MYQLKCTVTINVLTLALLTIFRFVNTVFTFVFWYSFLKQQQVSFKAEDLAPFGYICDVMRCEM
jgi:hypothetical protein